MKARTARKPVLPSGVFNDPARRPTDAEFNSTLGTSFVALDLLLTALRATRPTLAWEWKFSARTGWHRLCLLGQRRLFYLLPQTGGFRLSLIVGDRALAEAAAGPHATALRRLRKTAERFPEGTAFRFTAAGFDAPVVLGLLEAKLAH